MDNFDSDATTEFDADEPTQPDALAGLTMRELVELVPLTAVQS